MFLYKDNKSLRKWWLYGVKEIYDIKLVNMILIKQTCIGKNLWINFIYKKYASLTGVIFSLVLITLLLRKNIKVIFKKNS